MSAIRWPDGVTLVRLDSVDSTNAELRRRAAAGTAAPLAVLAAEQTGGRGRHGRSWASPPGNVYLSVLLRPGPDWPFLPSLSLVAGLAVAEAVEALAAGRAAGRLAVKWPNDVLLDGAKLAGILLESEMPADGAAPWLIVGIGINVARHPGSGTRYAATSLAAAGVAPGGPPDEAVDAVAAAVLDAFLARLATWRRDGLAALSAPIEARLAGRGRPARVEQGAAAFDGTVLGIAPDGALRLRLADGSERRVTAGEVSLTLSPSEDGGR